MSDHGHDHHDDHSNDDHSNDSHGEHHEEKWGDYNTEPPGSTNLPSFSNFSMIAFAVVLSALIGAIAVSSLRMTLENHEDHASHTGQAAEKGAPSDHGHNEHDHGH